MTDRQDRGLAKGRSTEQENPEEMERRYKTLDQIFKSVDKKLRAMGA